MTASAPALVAALRDGGAFELLLRLQRGKPRTIEQIREIAPAGIDLGAALITLEAAGLIRVGKEGLRIEAPEPVIANAVAAALARSRQRLNSWRHVLADLQAEYRSGGGAPGRAPDPAGEGRPVEMQLIAGDAGMLVPRMLAGEGPGLRLALPDLTRVQAQLRETAMDPAARLAGAQILVSAKALTNAPDRELLDALHRAGARLRVTGTVPHWVALHDAEHVMISVDEGRRPLSGVFETAAEPVVAALAAVFTSWWERAADYPFVGSLSEKALALRALGLSDEDAAQALGSSVRTLQREFAKFMDEVGVSSRFELGVWWSRHGQPGSHSPTE